MAFIPRRKDMVFCCKQHRETYYRRGALPFEKLVDDVTKRVLAGGLETRVSYLEGRVRVLEHRTDTEIRA